MEGKTTSVRIISRVPGGDRVTRSETLDNGNTITIDSDNEYFQYATTSAKRLPLVYIDILLNGYVVGEIHYRYIDNWIHTFPEESDFVITSSEIVPGFYDRGISFEIDKYKSSLLFKEVEPRSFMPHLVGSIAEDNDPANDVFEQVEEVDYDPNYTYSKKYATYDKFDYDILKRQEWVKFDLSRSGRSYGSTANCYATLKIKWGILFPNGTGIFKTREVEIKPQSNYVLPTRFLIDTGDWFITVSLLDSGDRRVNTPAYVYDDDISSKEYNAFTEYGYENAIDSRMNVIVYYSAEMKLYWDDLDNQEVYMRYSVKPSFSHVYRYNFIPITFNRLKNTKAGYYFMRFEYSIPSQTVSCDSLADYYTGSSINRRCNLAFTNVKDDDERFLPVVPYVIYDENDYYERKLRFRINGDQIRDEINRAALVEQKILYYVQWSSDGNFESITNSAGSAFVYTNCISINEDGTCSGIPSGHYDEIYFRFKSHTNYRNMVTRKIEDINID